MVIIQVYNSPQILSRSFTKCGLKEGDEAFLHHTSKGYLCTTVASWNKQVSAYSFLLVAMNPLSPIKASNVSVLILLPTLMLRASCLLFA